MSAFTFKPTSADALTGLKTEYRATALAPLDGMWETFTSMADHYRIDDRSGPVGYCAVNSERKMLQFFVKAPANDRAAFTQALANLGVKGAVVSTAEPAFLSLCMEKQSSVSEQAIMYHLAEGINAAAAEFPDALPVRPFTQSDLPLAVEFVVATIGADAGWLESYFGDLIKRSELHGLIDGDELVSTGECRPSPTQPAYADVGMIVGTDHRGKGIATNMLRQMITESLSLGLKPICSTECSNIAAQKAITKAGFTAYHRILEIAF